MLIAVCFFFKQKTAYEMRISDWSSDVCSSDLTSPARLAFGDSTASTSSDGPMFTRPRNKEATAASNSSRPAIKDAGGKDRSEERRVGKECVRTGRSRWSQDH